MAPLETRPRHEKPSESVRARGRLKVTEHSPGEPTGETSGSDTAKEAAPERSNAASSPGPGIRAQASREHAGRRGTSIRRAARPPHPGIHPGGHADEG